MMYKLLKRIVKLEELQAASDEKIAEMLTQVSWFEQLTAGMSLPAVHIDEEDTNTSSSSSASMTTN